jgi:hypothetical protein
MNTNPTIENRLAALERAWRASQKPKTVAAVLDSGVLAETFEAAKQAALPLKPSCRTLAVEQFSDGAQFKAPIASMIRLKGQWLTKLGFPPGQQVELKAVSRGVLVDLSEAIKPMPFKYPVAMTRAAYAATIEAGGHWEPESQPDRKADHVCVLDTGALEVLKLPGGQDVAGRVHDVFHLLLHAIDCTPGPSSRVKFSVLVDKHGNGRHSRVDLCSVCGPGDDAAPVITIMLPDED